MLGISIASPSASTAPARHGLEAADPRLEGLWQAACDLIDDADDLHIVLPFSSPWQLLQAAGFTLQGAAPIEARCMAAKLDERLAAAQALLAAQRARVPIAPNRPSPEETARRERLKAETIAAEEAERRQAAIHSWKLRRAVVGRRRKENGKR